MKSFIILNGFDRSGSSAISRTLATHPDIELIMQPFNSGFIRNNMYEPFESSKDQFDGIKFFTALEEGKIDNSLIKSQWHFKYSTTIEAKPNKLHLIKTTINHLAQRWMKKKFAEIPVWGIWRQPENIVSSIIRNGFYGKWYEDAIEEILPTVQKEDFLKHYLSFLNDLNNSIRKTAFLVAVRTHFFLEYLDGDKLLVYEKFVQDSNYLKYFLIQNNLREVSFQSAKGRDLNIIGKSVNDPHEFTFSDSDMEFMKEIFQPITSLFKTKFCHDQIS